VDEVAREFFSRLLAQAKGHLSDKLSLWTAR
jgi:hypothetical protein